MLLFAFACAPMDYQVDPKSGESSSGEEDSLSAPLAIGDAEFLDHAVSIKPVAEPFTKAFMDRRPIAKEAA